MRISAPVILLLLAFCVNAQKLERQFDIMEAPQISVVNPNGRVSVIAEETTENNISVSVESSQAVTADDVIFKAAGNSLDITSEKLKTKKRLDITIRTPPRARVKIRTESGEVRLAGAISSADVLTDTGTISTNIPLTSVKFNFLWLSSRPRFMSDVPLPKVEEKSGGKFSINGKLANPEAPPVKNKYEDDPAAEKSAKKEQVKTGPIELDLRTQRGVVLFNVDPKDIRADLSERQLTQAAKAIVRSGDEQMVEAIRQASPKFFGEYAKTLPPRRARPAFADVTGDGAAAGTFSGTRRANVRVTDSAGRAISGLQAKDFTLLENNRPAEITGVRPSTAPFNLVLLLDVSGSVEEYIDFIRKAARNFLDTAGPQDRISIITFRDDVQVLSDFTTDRRKLSQSLDTFEAGGGTAYYDALGYALTDTMKQFRGDRTAIVILSDGDDNRSFLPFSALTTSLGESETLIYPLYVPSELAAASRNANQNSADQVRTNFLGLSSRAEAEGAKLAEVSGGVYYPIRQLGDLQKAYDDVVRQLRTSYLITFRPDVKAEEAGRSAAPRIKVKVARENSYTRLTGIENVPAAEAGKN